MYLGKVIGTVVSTIKTPSLTGSKFLIVEKINQDLTAKKQTEIAVDTVGAGDGETVIVVGGSSARMSNGKKPASRCCDCRHCRYRRDITVLRV